jgi:hypothetical protein
MELRFGVLEDRAAGLEVSKDTRPGAASSDGRSTAENSENGGVHGVGTVVFTVSA